MIAEIEDALIALCDGCLTGADVASGPGEWDGAYLQDADPGSAGGACGMGRRRGS